MMRNLDIYSLALTLIRDNIQLVSNHSSDSMGQEILQGLFISALRFLKNFVIANTTNQW
jgi:hypothetical protein